MIPIVTPEEMARIDAAAPEPLEVLIARAGAAVARAALDHLGGTYGRRVVVLAGGGNNGADGRVAGELLAARGVRVTVVGVEEAGPSLPPADLVIDAAFGTGLSRPYEPPATDAPVLAVDLPSGLDGYTGRPHGFPLPAALTVTFGALKPGHVLGQGPRLCGSVQLAGIGLDVSGARASLVEAADVGAALPVRERGAHKWSSAVRVVAGSPGMEGAATLAALSAARAGSGMVVVSGPGGPAPGGLPVEVVGRSLPENGWVEEVLDDIERFGALVIGPGLGQRPDVLAATADLIAQAPVPVLVDADGLRAVAARPDSVRKREQATVVTPHDGEFATLVGEAPGADRFNSARALAEHLQCVALLKGSTTLVTDPETGHVHVVTTGDERLATAGTGDVLAGAIGALLAGGLDGPTAAWAGAFLHGWAARRLPPAGLLAGDLAAALGPARSGLRP